MNNNVFSVFVASTLPWRPARSIVIGGACC